MKDLKESLNEVREIKVEKDLLRFLFLKDGTKQDEMSLKTGSDYITKTYFKHDTPTEAEVERAINYIEDELMRDKKLVNHGETLHCTNKNLAEMLKVSDKSTVTRDYFESIFNKYADFVTGEPAHMLRIDFTPEKLATILLVREIMFHLNFNQIEITQ